MSPPDPVAFTAVVLAGQRPGRADPLAAEAGLSNKSLLPIDGAPLIRHVAAALAGAPGLARLRVVAEPEAHERLRAALPPIGAPVDLIPAADNLADSVYAAADGVDGAIVVTTSDNVLLTAGAVLDLLEPLSRGADVTLAMATEASVRAAHPDGQRRFYRFADGAYSNCNLYGFVGGCAVRAAESFRSGGQFAKKPLRMIWHLGPINLGLLLLGRLTLKGALRRLSRRFALTVEPVVLGDGAHAIDVDNPRTFACAEEILRRRAMALAA